MLPQLYSFRRCPYAMRARLALQYAGIVVQIHEVQLRAKPPELLRLSPKGTVPVLLLPSGEVLEQSADIMFWALAQADPQAWRRPDLDAQALPWLALNDGPFKQLLDRYKYPDRHPQATQPQWRSEAEALMLVPLDALLQRSTYLLGATPSWLDLALLPFVRQFAAVDAAWFEAAPHAALRGWLHRWLASDLFAAIMAKPPFAAQSPASNC
ncbi:glutathione S-transferase [Paucibacter sp. B2R-40]|uniref:glutathione S-transferase n=1 Tax=Paucibacter sp. B2R-40 TaxID=2893554 RepID=UPI0021E3A438|nr:glutathione S-transferase [Paucibacter sp. B2R-40]MCV2353619.1 glutathione S-transferase [Paucibacter sp. B2R-40]